MARDESQRKRKLGTYWGKTFVCLESMIKKLETLLHNLMENKKKQGLVQNNHKTIT